MNLEEDDFFSWHIILINFLPISHPFFFLFLRSFFLIVSATCKNVAKVFQHQVLVPAWPRIIKNRLVLEHTGTFIWTKLYLVSYHSFENPPLVLHFSLCKTVVLTNFDFWVSVIYISQRKIAIMWIYCWKWKPELCLLLITKFKL